MATRDQAKAADFAHIYRGPLFARASFILCSAPRKSACAPLGRVLGSFQWADDRGVLLIPGLGEVAIEVAGSRDGSGPSGDVVE
eukprot:10868980-Alexandrium_andersonii.AAC.1